MLRVCELFEGPGEVLLRDGIVTKPSLVDDTTVREIRVVRRIRLRNVKVSSDGHLKQLLSHPYGDWATEPWYFLLIAN